jgi:tRNA(fMet)-specific endonuclease VapC
MEFLLDTDTCIYAIKKQPDVLSELLAISSDDVAVSVVTEAELRTGAAKSASPVKAIHRLENFLRPFTILDFTSQDAIAYAQIRARLEHAGTPIGPNDTMIAAHAVARDLTLVTNNEREFRRVSGLRITNWRR